jgi:hypothetical protein
MFVVQVGVKTECKIYGCRSYSERQKYGINSLKIKQNFFQKNPLTGQNPLFFFLILIALLIV